MVRLRSRLATGVNICKVRLYACLMLRAFPTIFPQMHDFPNL
jgi:hypothetical protein